MARSDSGRCRVSFGRLDEAEAPVSDRPAVEDHGRVVTATMQAVAFYRQAQQAVDSAQTVPALRRAVNADPAFGLAVADLDAITQGAPAPLQRPPDETGNATTSKSYAPQPLHYLISPIPRSSPEKRAGYWDPRVGYSPDRRIPIRRP